MSIMVCHDIQGIVMSEDQIITLLSEIRDLQKQHLENYKIALSNQQQALETQKQSVRRARTLLVAVGVVVLALYLLPMFWWGMSWTLSCALRR
jgi:fatty acid desaturase